MAADRAVSKVAVYGEPVEPKPGLIAKFVIKTVQDDGHVSGNVLPFSFRDTLATVYHAPIEADYIFQFRMLNRRGLAPGVGGPKPLIGAALEAQLEASRHAAPPVEFRIDIDGKTVTGVPSSAKRPSTTPAAPPPPKSASPPATTTSTSRTTPTPMPTTTPAAAASAPNTWKSLARITPPPNPKSKSS